MNVDLIPPAAVWAAAGLPAPDGAAAVCLACGGTDAMVGPDPDGGWRTACGGCGTAGPPASVYRHAAGLGHRTAAVRLFAAAGRGRPKPDVYRRWRETDRRRATARRLAEPKPAGGPALTAWGVDPSPAGWWADTAHLRLPAAVRDVNHGGVWVPTYDRGGDPVGGWAVRPGRAKYWAYDRHRPSRGFAGRPVETITPDVELAVSLAAVAAAVLLPPPVVPVWAAPGAEGRWAGVEAEAVAVRVLTPAAVRLAVCLGLPVRTADEDGRLGPPVKWVAAMRAAPRAAAKEVAAALPGGWRRGLDAADLTWVKRLIGADRSPPRVGYGAGRQAVRRGDGWVDADTQAAVLPLDVAEAGWRVSAAGRAEMILAGVTGDGTRHEAAVDAREYLADPRPAVVELAVTAGVSPVVGPRRLVKDLIRARTAARPADD